MLSAFLRGKSSEQYRLIRSMRFSAAIESSGVDGLWSFAHGANVVGVVVAVWPLYARLCALNCDAGNVSRDNTSRRRRRRRRFPLTVPNCNKTGFTSNAAAIPISAAPANGSKCDFDKCYETNKTKEITMGIECEAQRTNGQHSFGQSLNWMWINEHTNAGTHTLEKLSGE